MDTIEGNKLIAEFMGIDFSKAKYSYRPGVEEPLTEDRLAYHSSWDWLMPVVEKIESIHDDFNGYFGVHIYSNSCTIQGTNLRTDPENFHPAYMSDPNAILNTKIESTWYNIIQFIKWYKAQSELPKPETKS